MPSPGPFELPPIRSAIIGAGAMGTCLAAVLGRSMPVVMVCRNAERAAAIFRSGARAAGAIEAVSAPIVVRSIADLASIGGVSVVFVATKTGAIAEVARELRPVLDRIGDRPGAPYIVSFQNGIDPGKHLASMLGDARVLRMVLDLGAVLHPPDDHAHVFISAPPHAIGTVNPEHRAMCAQIAAMLTRAGFPTEFEPDIEARVWRKGLINAAVNPVAALVNATVGEVMNSPARTIVDRLLREGLAVARAERLDLGVGFLDAAYALIDRAEGHLPSMVEDIRAGKQSEIDQLNRQVIEHARRLDVPVPTHEIIDSLIGTFDWRVYSRRHAATPPPCA